MRIHLLVTDTLARGGIQRFNQALIQELRAAVSDADTVRVFSLNDPPSPDFGGFGRRKIQFVRTALTAALANQPDLVILGHVNFSPLAIAYRVACRSARILTVAYGEEVEHRRNLLSLLGLRVANGIICISESTRQFVSRVQGISYDRTYLLHYGLPQIETPLPSATDTPDGTLELLTVSRLDPSQTYKGVDATIEAVGLLREAHPRLRYRIAGDGDDLPRLQRLVERLDLADCVRLAGNVDDRSLARMYEEADIFVLPSTREGFGIVYLEAMARGKPVIAVRSGGVPDIVVHETNGLLLDDQDPGKIAAALSRLASDAPLRQRLGEFGRTVTFPQFSRERMRATLTTILDIPDTPSGNSFSRHTAVGAATKDA